MDELKKQKIWICWRMVNGQKKPIAASGIPTSANVDKHGCTYVTYQAALDAANKNGYAGVAFVIPKGYFFLDIDKRGNDALTRLLLDRFGCYAEKSQSNNGFHIYGKCDFAKIPAKDGKVDPRYYVKNPNNQLELYIGGLTNRIACFTGEAINDKPLIDATQAVLVTLQHEMLRKDGASKPISGGGELFDVICDCRRFKNQQKFTKLYDLGDWSDYGSQSEADMALCSLLAFRAGNNPDLIDQAFRNSALYRSKWERDDYRNTTITKAIGSLDGNFYDPYHGKYHGKSASFIYLDKNDQVKVSPVLLAKALQGTVHFIQVKNSGKESAQKYVYENGVYKLYDDNMFKALLKNLIETVDPMLVNSAVINESFKQLMMETQFIPHSALNADENIINFQNGLLYLPTMELQKHTPDVYTTIQIPCDWSGIDLPTPAFDRYLNDLFPDDPQSRHLLLQFIGICLSNIPGHRAKKALFIYGEGDTGKSQIKKFAESLVGSAAYTSLELDDLEKRFATSQMYGKRICGSSDMRFSAIPELSIFKRATGGDPINAEFKGEAAFEFVYQGVLWYCGNRLPRFGGDDGAWVYDRMIILACHNVIPKEQQDPLLQDKLYAERDGVVYKAVLAAKEVVSNNYRYAEPKSQIETRKEYREENNSVLSFLRECCEKSEDVDCMKGWCTTGTLYRIYCQWCKDNGRRFKSSNEFRRQIAAEYKTPHQDLIAHTRIGNIYTCLRLNTVSLAIYRPQFDLNFQVEEKLNFSSTNI